MSASPYSPEPPCRSRIVDFIMLLSRRRGAASTCCSPHLHGGDDLAKARYEYESANLFWEGFRVGEALLRDRDVIDIGCGWGGKTVHVAEHGGPRSIFGFDLPGVFEPESAAAFAESRGVSTCRFGIGAAEHIDAADSSFDVAMMDDVIEHVADPESVLGECWRVLRPGGILLARFPSIRMMQAHHFDRAVTYPGLHYLMSFRRWAAGFNDYLLRSNDGPLFEPFDEVVATRYHSGLTRNLNGLDARRFELLVQATGFSVLQLDLVPLSPSTATPFRRARARVYRRLWGFAPLKELLSNRIVFVGERRGGASSL